MKYLKKKKQLNNKVSEDKTVELQNTINALRNQIKHYETSIDKLNVAKSEAYKRLYDLRFEVSTRDKMEQYISDLKTLGDFYF